jgi:lactate dehydrogenase-like 2-hydroxyacid dehydrogenase
MKLQVIKELTTKMKSLIIIFFAIILTSHGAGYYDDTRKQCVDLVKERPECFTQTDEGIVMNCTFNL